MFFTVLSGRQQRAESGEIAADIAVAGEAQRAGICAVLIERQLGDHVVVAAVVVRHETAGALVGPFHRPAERARACRMQTYSG